MTYNTLRRLDALNKWLADVYGVGTSFGILLSDKGFSKMQIEQIKQEHLDEFLQTVVALLDSYHDLRSEARNMLMIQHYGLANGKPQALHLIGHNLGVCRERIRQLVYMRLVKYHNPERQAKFRYDFAAIGRYLLAKKISKQEITHCVYHC